MVFLCIPILVLNAKGRFSLAAFLLSFVILVVITVNLYDGDGVHDLGLLSYLIFIMVGTLLFGKRASPYFAIAAIGSLTLIVWLEFFKYTHSVAYSHHERWDGQGYPEGLKGEEIPLLARLFAVVDRWDAL